MVLEDYKRLNIETVHKTMNIGMVSGKFPLFQNCMRLLGVKQVIKPDLQFFYN